MPYNNLTAGSVVVNNIDVMRLDGYLVSQNNTINFPVLGELSVKEKTTQDLESDIKKLLDDLLVNQEKLTKTERVKVFVTLSGYLFTKNEPIKEKIEPEKPLFNIADLVTFESEEDSTK